MNLLPFENFYIISRFPCEEVQSRLEKAIDRPNYYPFTRRLLGQPQPSFVGKIANGRFKVRPEISGRNSFLPMIRGSIEPYMAGSKIHVKFKMHVAVIIFLLAWCGFLGYSTIRNIHKNLNRSQIDSIIPFAMILFAIVFAIVEFNRQSRKAKKKLLQITGGEICRDPA